MHWPTEENYKEKKWIIDPGSSGEKIVVRSTGWGLLSLPSNVTFVNAQRVQISETEFFRPVLNFESGGSKKTAVDWLPELKTEIALLIQIATSLRTLAINVKRLSGNCQ